MREWTTYEDEEWERRRQPSRLGFAGLVLLLFLGGAALYRISGPPHLPASLPSKEVILYTLRGSDPPMEALAYIFSTAAWALWIWIVGSLVLELLVVTAELISRGAAWAKSLRSVSNWVTLPVVRQVVDGALIAVVVVNLVSRTVPTASAAPLPSTRITLVEPDSRRAGAPSERHLSHAGYLVPDDEEDEEEDEEPETTYTVQRGDTLWTIAERFYGTGYEYKRLMTANVGRQMPDGRYFTKAGMIQPGWVLVIPEPSTALERANGKTFYVVEQDDSLRGIAARFLGDEMRWPEIYDLNQGKAKLPDGRTLKHPDLIWPGLRLEIPEKVKKAEPAPTSQPKPAQAVPKLETPAPKVEDPSPAPVVTPEPTPAPIRLTPALTQVLSEPTAVPTPAVQLDPAAPLREEPSTPAPLPLYAAAGGAALLAAGGAALFRRRRPRYDGKGRRAPLEESGPQISGGFAEAEFDRELAQCLWAGEADPATLYAGAALRFFAEQGVGEVAVLSVQHGRDSLTLTLRAGLAQRERLLALAPELGRRLGGTARASTTECHDVLVEVSDLRGRAPAPSASDSPDSSLAFLPLGVLYDRQVLAGNWREMGHVLVAGLPGGGAETILTSVVGALAARYRPEELRLYTVASDHALPRQVLDLPHQCRGRIDPTDELSASAVLAELKAELLRRMKRHEATGDRKWAPTVDEPNLVLLVGELGDLKDAGDDGGAAYDLIAAEGSKHGIQILAASTRAERLEDYVTCHLKTRLVLRMAHEEQSVILLGDYGAADLGAGGHMLAQIADCSPVQVRGFRISPEHLDRLVALMRKSREGVAATGGTELAAGLDGAPGSALTEPREAPGAQVKAAGEAPVPEENVPVPAGSADDPLPQPGEVTTNSDDEPDEEDEEAGVGSSLDVAAGEVGLVGIGEMDPAEALPATGDGHRGDDESLSPDVGLGEPAAAVVAGEPTLDPREADPPPDHERANSEEPGVSANGRSRLVLGPKLLADHPSVERSDLNGRRNGQSHDPTEVEPGSVPETARPEEPATGEPQAVRPPIRLRCFGQLVVRCGEREIVPSVGEGGLYKGWAILAFLGAHPTVSREVLLATFWPDVDSERAANSLYVTLKRLRKLFAAQAPELTEAMLRELPKLEREGSVSLGPHATSDVHEFLTLCRQAPKLPPPEAKAALVRARELYVGDLLKHQGGSFYAWLDERDGGVSPRERCRAEQTKATYRLAKLLRQEGSFEEAIALYRELLEADPTREEVVRELYRCYGESGDLRLLVREERHLREALRAAYQDPADLEDDPSAYEPEPKTVALFEETRRQLEAKQRRAIDRRDDGRG